MLTLLNSLSKRRIGNVIPLGGWWDEHFTIDELLKKRSAA